MENSSKIRLMIVSETTAGGVGRHLFDLITGLDKNKYEIFFVYSTVRADKSFTENIKILEDLEVKLFILPMHRDIRPFLDMTCLVNLIKLIKKVSPDIIHLHSAKAGAIGRIAAILTGNKNIIYNPHGGSFHLFRKKLGFIYLFIEKILATKHVYLIAVSEFSLNEFKKHLKIDLKNIRLIYNGVDSKSVLNVPKLNRTEFGISEDDFIVLFPAMFLKAKGHLEFLHEAAKCPEKLNPGIKILLAGDGQFKSKIESVINLLNINDQFKMIGFQKNINSFYDLCDLVILPSRNEFLPYVLIEAMAFSKPVLATNVGGIPEIVRNKYNGELFSPDELCEMIKKINELSENRSLMEEMGKNGRKIAEEKFSIKEMIRKTDALYRELVN